MNNPRVAVTIKSIVVIENEATHRSFESNSYPTGTALDIQCMCGTSIFIRLSARRARRAARRWCGARDRAGRCEVGCPKD